MSFDSDKGKAAEDHVEALLRKRDYSLLRKRWKTPYAEVDLLMGNDRELLLVEVKTMSRGGFEEHRVSPVQKARLKRAQMFIQSRSVLDVRLIFAFVQANGQIQLFNPGEDDLK